MKQGFPIAKAVAGMLLVAVTVPAAPRVSAQAPPAQAAVPAPSGDPRERARVLFERGAAAYAERRYYEAIDVFLETQRVYPTPHVAFNIAKTYDQVGNHSGALRYYRDYLRSSSEAADAGEVSARIRELEAILAQRGIQQVTVLSEPEGAAVFLDDEAIGVTPFTGERAPGQYRVKLRLAGFSEHEGTIELSREKSAEIRVELAAAPKPPAPKPRAESPRSNWPTNRVGTLTWVSFALGSAALAGALAVEATADADNRGFTQGGAFLAGTGAAFALTGGVLLCFDLCSGGTGPGVGLSVGRESAGAKFGGTF